MSCESELPATLSDSKDFLLRIMGAKVTVETTDGRQFFGSLLCTDRDANIVMKNAVEYPAPGTAVKDDLTRRLFLITIRGAHIKRMLIDKGYLPK